MRSMKKNWPKNEKFQNFFSFSKSVYFCLSPRQISMKSDNFYFLTPKPQFRGLKGSKNKSCPILTKFGVVIVRSTLIKKTKKNFEIFHFWADFWFLNSGWKFEVSITLNKLLKKIDQKMILFFQKRRVKNEADFESVFSV